MSIPAYKVGNEISVVYQAAGAATGQTIAMDVYDEAQVYVSGSSVAAMTEIGSTGRYRASFTPDAEGDWILQMYDSVNNTGKVVKQYEVIGHDVDSVGDEVALVKAATDNLPADPADQSAVEAAITASETTIVGEIDDLESPAMVG